MKPTSVSRMKKFPFTHKQLLQWSSRASSSLRSRIFNSSLYLSRTVPASSSTPPPVFSYQALNFSSTVQSLRYSASMEGDLILIVFKSNKGLRANNKYKMEKHTTINTRVLLQAVMGASHICILASLLTLRTCVS
ncbi:hypothetical protein ACB092_08G067500 [Castanea dentata]